MAMNQWSRRSIVLVIVACAIAGFLIGSSSSQDRVKTPGEKQYETEVGRHQIVQTTDGGLLVFDTKNAKFWTQSPKSEGWKEHNGPFQKPAK